MELSKICFDFRKSIMNHPNIDCISQISIPSNQNIKFLCVVCLLLTAQQQKLRISYSYKEGSVFQKRNLFLFSKYRKKTWKNRNNYFRANLWIFILKLSDGIYEKYFQVLSLHYIHTRYTFFPPKRQVIRAKRTDKLLFTSLLILSNGLLEISSNYFSK